jgi:hypothetical protein
VVDDHAIFAMLAALLHDHGVGAGRDRGAGEDAGSRAGLQRRTNRTGRYALADRQADAGGGDVGGAHGVTVHGRVVERRHGDGGALGLGEHAAKRGRQRQRAGFLDGLGSGQQLFQGLFKTQHGRSCKFRWAITKSAMAA